MFDVWVMATTMTRQTTDQARLEAARAGDRAAAEALYRRFGQAVYHFALWRLGDAQAAEDVAQEVFLRLLHGGGMQPRGEDLKGYFLGIARHIMIDAARRQATERRVLDKAVLLREDASRPDAAPEEAERINALLRALPVEQREAIVLHLYEDMTFEQVGGVLGIPAGTAESRFYLGIAKLKPILQRDRM